MPGLVPYDMMGRMALTDYELVTLGGGARSVKCRMRGETFHPVIGPVAEAEALYVRQLRLRERLTSHAGEFVVWDVGLGAAANAITVLRSCRDLPSQIRMLSFDQTTDPLWFGLNHAADLGYFGGYESRVQTLLDAGRCEFEDGPQRVNWTLHLGDFPSLLKAPSMKSLPKPHAILFDAYSPARNPDMWTLEVFERLHGQLDAARPCAMPTYSRSTLLRVTLLCAGFYVGAGHATGEKEETTIAANDPSLIDEPLDAAWLKRAGNSTSAEPLRQAVYVQSPLTQTTRARLLAHPQFRGTL